MSRDLQLAWQCPHLTVEEHVSLGDDRQSLETRQPIAGSGTVRILINNDDRLFIPQSGLSVPARLRSTASGPFDLTEGEDTIIIEGPRGEVTVSFGVAGTQRFTTDQIIQRLLREQREDFLFRNDNGHLSFADVTTAGPDSFVRVRGTAAGALGFGIVGSGNNRQRGARGRDLYPGWILLPRGGDPSDRFPFFVAPISKNPMFKVTYTVPVRRCLRCQGGIIENDFRFDESGQGILIGNEDLLHQAALKILLTDRGSNTYHDWYGSTIRSRIGAKAIGGVAAAISEDVRRTLARMQSVQKEQSEYQQVTAKERIYSILQVRTVPHVQDQTTFLVEVTVQNASAEPISLSIVFTVPQVVALLGSNGLFLGTQAAGLEAERANRLFARGSG